MSHRVGLIVPSSNTTMETEIPAMLRAREQVYSDRFTFHSARMRMRKVTLEELKSMDGVSHQCAAELTDARVDVIAYACLVAIMSMGLGYHQVSEKALGKTVVDAGVPIPVITSAGALVQGLQTLGAKSVSMVMPYMPPLAKLVREYVENEGIEVIDSLAFGIEDNLEVGRRDPQLLINDIEKLNTTGADAVVLSACVQMPSLGAIPAVEDKLGLPVLTAATATTRSLLDALGLEPKLPGGGALLA